MHVFPLLKAEVKGLFPAYFALVMSTGIVSIAAHMQSYQNISTVLFCLNNGIYGILLLMFLGRVLFFFPDFKDDLRSHAKGAGFLKEVVLIYLIICAETMTRLLDFMINFRAWFLATQS